MIGGFKIIAITTIDSVGYIFDGLVGHLLYSSMFDKLTALISSPTLVVRIIASNFAVFLILMILYLFYMAVCAFSRFTYRMSNYSVHNIVGASPQAPAPPPVAAGAAPAAHNYEDAGIAVNVSMLAHRQPNPGDEADILINEELVSVLIPVSYLQPYDSLLYQRMIARANSWKNRTAITNFEFQRVLPGSISKALMGTPETLKALYCMSHNATIRQLASATDSEGTLSFPRRTLQDWKNGEAYMFSVLYDYVRPRQSFRT
jgi:hypothetical protein